MKKYLKMNLTAIVVVMLVVGTMGLSAAVIDNNPSKKAAKAKKVVPIEQWYSLASTANSTPSLQQITGFASIPDMENPEGCSQIKNDGDFCTVLIRFESGSAPDFALQTVQDALNSGGTIVDSKATEGYSRLPHD